MAVPGIFALAEDNPDAGYPKQRIMHPEDIITSGHHSAM